MTGTPPVFFFQAEDGIRDYKVTGVQTCALPIWVRAQLQRDALSCVVLAADASLRTREKVERLARARRGAGRGGAGGGGVGGGGGGAPGAGRGGGGGPVGGRGGGGFGGGGGEAAGSPSGGGIWVF